MPFRQPSVLPGFGLTFGFTTFFLSAIVLIPLAALVLMAGSMPWHQFAHVVLSARALASYRLSFGASLLAASINLVFGFIIAWTLVRYEFAGRKLIDALIDMPFALPTAVSGIALTTVFAENGWIGRYLSLAGIRVGSGELQSSALLLRHAPDSLPYDLDGYLGTEALHAQMIELDFASNTLRWQTK